MIQKCKLQGFPDDSRNNFSIWAALVRGGRKPCVSTDDAFVLLQVKLASGRPPMHLLPMPCVKPVAMASFVALLQTFANSSLRDLLGWPQSTQPVGRQIHRRLGIDWNGCHSVIHEIHCCLAVPCLISTHPAKLHIVFLKSAEDAHRPPLAVLVPFQF